MPEEAVRWIQSYRTDISTHIKLPELASEKLSTPHGIPQGSPLSPIFYNADLVERTARRDLGAETMAWTDDVGILVTGKSTQDNCAARGEDRSGRRGPVGAKPLVHLRKGQVQPHPLHEEEGPKHYRYDDPTDSVGAGPSRAAATHPSTRSHARQGTQLERAHEPHPSLGNEEDRGPKRRGRLEVGFRPARPA